MVYYPPWMVENEKKDCYTLIMDEKEFPKSKTVSWTWPASKKKYELTEQKSRTGRGRRRRKERKLAAQEETVWV